MDKERMIKVYIYKSDPARRDGRAAGSCLAGHLVSNDSEKISSIKKRIQDELIPQGQQLMSLTYNDAKLENDEDTLKDVYSTTPEPKPFIALYKEAPNRLGPLLQQQQRQAISSLMSGLRPGSDSSRDFGSKLNDSAKEKKVKLAAAAVATPVVAYGANKLRKNIKNKKKGGGSRRTRRRRKNRSRTKKRYHTKKRSRTSRRTKRRY